MKASKTKLQAPEKHQVPNTKFRIAPEISKSSFGWRLVCGASLDIGSWILDLRSARRDGGIS
jgi:hypothetical protein